jgi:hypothetical protein
VRIAHFLRVAFAGAALAVPIAACQSGGMHLDGTTWSAHHGGTTETIAFHDRVVDVDWDMTRMMSVPYRPHGPQSIEIVGDGIHWTLTMDANGDLNAVDASGRPMHFVKQ